MTDIIDLFMKYYLEMAPSFLKKEEWGAFVFLLILSGIIQILAYSYLKLFKKIKCDKRRGQIIGVTTGIVFSLGTLIFYYSKNNLTLKNFIFICVVGIFFLLIGYLDKLFPKINISLDIKSDLNLKKDSKQKGTLYCPVCDAKTISSLNVLRKSQTCGECLSLISIDKRYFNVISYSFITLGLITILFLYMAFNLNYNKQVLYFSLIGIQFVAIAFYLFYNEKLVQKYLKKEKEKERP